MCDMAINTSGTTDVPDICPFLTPQPLERPEVKGGIIQDIALIPTNTATAMQSTTREMFSISIKCTTAANCSELRNQSRNQPQRET